PGGAGQPLAVGAERHALYCAGVPLEGEGLLAGLRSEDLRGGIVGGAGQPLAVGAERHAGDCAGVPLEGEGVLAGLRVADRGGLVWSEGAVARRLPSGLNATLITAPVCPWRVRACWPVCASHTFTVWS